MAERSRVHLFWKYGGSGFLFQMFGRQRQGLPVLSTRADMGHKPFAATLFPPALLLLAPRNPVVEKHIIDWGFCERGPQGAG